MKTKFIITLFLALTLLSLSSEKRKKKKASKSSSPDSLRPTSVSFELFCDSCEAILLEAMKFLRGKKKESDILDYMTDVCNPEKYNIYHFPPPDMRSGCEAFIAAYGDEVEKALINRENDETPVQKLCYEQTKVCVGVDWNNIKQMDDNIMIDGEPVKIADLQKTKPDEDSDKAQEKKENVEEL